MKMKKQMLAFMLVGCLGAAAMPASEATRIYSGDTNLLVVSYMPDYDDYYLRVQTGDVSESNHGLVTGETVYNYIQEMGTGTGTTYTAGDYVHISDNRISVNVNGAIEEGDTGIVTGDTVYQYVKGMGTGTTYTAGDHISINDNKISVDASGSVMSGDGRIVTGNSVYKAMVAEGI